MDSKRLSARSCATAPTTTSAALLSYDGDLIYGLTDEGREQRDFVVFDPAQGKVTKTLFTKPGIDVVKPLFDARRNPIG